MSPLQDEIEEWMRRRVARTASRVLSAKDANVDPFLPDDVSATFRKVVLDELNDLADVVVGMLERVARPDVTFNAALLERIGEDVAELRTALTNGVR